MGYTASKLNNIDVVYIGDQPDFKDLSFLSYLIHQHFKFTDYFFIKQPQNLGI